MYPPIKSRTSALLRCGRSSTVLPFEPLLGEGGHPQGEGELPDCHPVQVVERGEVEPAAKGGVHAGVTLLGAGVREGVAVPAPVDGGVKVQREEVVAAE
jgi:hypothetical protein